MKILIVTCVFKPEPIVSARLSYDLAIKLSKNHEVTVICPKPSRPLGYEFDRWDPRNEKFKINYLKSFKYPKSKFIGRLFESYSFGIKTSKYIRKNKSSFDIVYINTWPLIAQYLTVRAASDNGIHTIIHVQDIYPESMISKLPLRNTFIEKALILLDKSVLNKSNKVVVISDNMKKHLIKSRNISAKKLTIIQNWQNEEEFLNIKNSTQLENNNLFTFMYMGNIGPVAGLEDVIIGFRELDCSKCQLVIAGSGSRKNELIKFVQKNLIERVYFEDVPDGKVAEVQSKAHVLLLPMKKGSSLSSIPSKLPAYMFSKKAIIAAVDKDSDTARAIFNSNSGWIIEPENHSELTKIMKKAFSTNLQRLNSMGLRGYNYAIMEFSKKENLKKLADLILEI